MALSHLKTISFEVCVPNPNRVQDATTSSGDLKNCVTAESRTQYVRALPGSPFRRRDVNVSSSTRGSTIF